MQTGVPRILRRPGAGAWMTIYKEKNVRSRKVLVSAMNSGGSSVGQVLKWAVGETEEN